jgi:hypothetical protein
VCPREEGLKAGKKEFMHIGEFEVVLYWEPHSVQRTPGGPYETAKSFTVEVNFPSGRVERYRYDTLAEADAQVEAVKHGQAVYIARKAFGLK